jgi:hypothetical protein
MIFHPPRKHDCELQHNETAYRPVGIELQSIQVLCLFVMIPPSFSMCTEVAKFTHDEEAVLGLLSLFSMISLNTGDDGAVTETCSQT